MATAILEGIAKGFQQKGRPDNCQDCQDLIRQLYRNITLSKPVDDLIFQKYDSRLNSFFSPGFRYTQITAKKYRAKKKETKIRLEKT